MERLGSGEVATLVIGLLAAFVFLQARRERPGAIPPAFLAGVGCTLAAYVFTLLEEFASAGLFNLLEHASMAAAGLAFLLGARSRDPGGDGGG